MPKLRSSAVLAGLVVLIVGFAVAAVMVAPYLKHRILAAAGANKPKRLDVTLFPRPRISGEGYVTENGEISVERFSADANWLGLLRRPVHIRQARVEGLKIVIPRGQPADKRHIGDFEIDEMIADGSVLIILPKDEGKEPLQFDLERLTVHGAGPHSAMSYRATLTNPRPPGEIQTSGKFGPWQEQNLRATPVSGDYTFQNADLSVFPGIRGTLSSQGSFRGVLERIEVNGHTDTPEFALRVSGNPIHLTTQFQAIVDGSDGDTHLQRVEGQFGHSSVIAQGKVEHTQGKPGKTIDLDATVENGRLEDMLRLAVAGAPAMSGQIAFHANITIPPGNADIAEKIHLKGRFNVTGARFSKREAQDKLDQLSLRGRGQPEAAENEDASQAGRQDIAADFGGHFEMDTGVIAFRDLGFKIPGLDVELAGTYALEKKALDLRGTARLEAKLSQTVTGVKSTILKVVDPFFEKKNAGALVPISITGTPDSPSFGLNLKGKKK